MSLKRARIDLTGAVGLVRSIDVIEGQASRVHEELRRMIVSKYAIQTSGWVCDLTINEIVSWASDGPDCTPDIILKYCEGPMLLTGLENIKVALNEADKLVMSNMISALMQGFDFTGDVDLSINQGQVRMMGGRKKISSILAFVYGKCNMKLGRTITCDDGTQVDEISWAMLPAEQLRHFASIKVPFFLFNRLTVENEKTIVAANWDGFFEKP